MDAQIAVELGYGLHPDTDDSWAEYGLCKGMTEVFSVGPPNAPSGDANREILARSICAICPVQMPCRRAGRLNHEHGIWGGENDEERALAGYTPRSPSRRSVIAAQKQAQESSEDDHKTALAS